MEANDVTSAPGELSGRGEQTTPPHSGNGPGMPVGDSSPATTLPDQRLTGIGSPWEHMRETLLLAAPVAVGQLGHVMLGVVDSAMVGRVGTTPLAAAALVNSLFFLLFVTGAGVSLAITPLVAIERGAGRIGRCWDVLRNGLVVNLSFGAFCSVAGIAASYALHVLGQPAEVVAEAASYLRIMSINYLPMMAYHALRQYVEGLGETRPAMIIAIAANGVNAALNWVFIYGNLGMPALGLDGAGWSSVVTELGMTAALAAYVLRAGRFRESRRQASAHRLDRALLRRLVSIGVPSGLQHLFEVSAFSASAIMIGWAGRVSLAAHQVALSLASVTYMIILGISAAATIRVGTAFGQGASARLRRAGFTAIGLAAAVMGGFGLAFVVFRTGLPGLYVTDPAVIDTAATLLIIAAVFQIMDGTQAVSMGALRGITDVRVPSIISFVAYWLVALPIGYLFGIHYGGGAAGVWIGFVFGLLAASSLFLFRFHLLTRPRLPQA